MALNFLYPKLRQIIDQVTGFGPEGPGAARTWR